MGEKTVSPRLLIFSDLDGCLLDAESYALGPAEPVLRMLRSQGIPLVLCTTKTRSEIVALYSMLGGRYVTVLEDGAGILVPPATLPCHPSGARMTREGAFLSLSIPYSAVRRHFAALRRHMRGGVVGFGDLTVPEVARLTRLPLSAARRARRREFDEPFYFLREDREQQRRARRFARDRGLRIMHGGRLFHLHGNTDKGVGARLVRRMMGQDGRRWRVAALGDGALDAPLLRMADIAVIIPGLDGRPDPALRRRLPWARVAALPGPAGWAQAVQEMLGNE
ncbi:MAG: hypothetical protein HY703_12040 [Gemmatimonadetes bacterium]|nr:hypothetical protein [Gemmatimonadota bacterium]